MTRRPVLFLIITVLVFAVGMGLWVGACLYEKPPATVPAGQTASINGVEWRLDFIQQVPPDDPAIARSTMTRIDGAAYLKVQYTYASPEDISVCVGRIIGADRQWSASYLGEPSDPGVTSGCTSATKATQQMIALVPPSAVNEINAVELSLPGYWVRLAGRVTQ
ncbi:MAG: hypothetical protein FWD63_04220 [Propionibacteriaceae bacterium]|nr:hypothetical protein [Propionibacteriaceae bacterium]